MSGTVDNDVSNVTVGDSSSQIVGIAMRKSDGRKPSTPFDLLPSARCTPGNLTITDSTLTSNTAGTQGGHVFASALSTVVVSNSTAQNGKAAEGGG